MAVHCIIFQMEVNVSIFAIITVIILQIISAFGLFCPQLLLNYIDRNTVNVRANSPPIK